MDPRTLAEAAARLAKYTSDEGDGQGAPPPHQQWADVYKETGPDGLGGLGTEPLVDLLTVPACQPGGGPRPTAAAVSGASGGTAEAVAAVWHVPILPVSSRGPRPTWHLSCGASRLLSCEAGGQGLLGLSDDVDCAVLRVRWEAPTAGGEPVPTVSHECYIPALAYVVAGKLQRKHLLLGGWAWVWEWTVNMDLVRHGDQKYLVFVLCMFKLGIACGLTRL